MSVPPNSATIKYIVCDQSTDKLLCCYDQLIGQVYYLTDSKKTEITHQPDDKILANLVRLHVSFFILCIVWW